MFLALLSVSFLCAAIPCALFCLNLRRYLPPPPAAPDLPAVSILIPARNEAAGIAEALRTALLTHGIPFEIIVMDDSSTDGTADIVLTHAKTDSRIRLERAPNLPPGWNGKQHACWALAQAARHPLLCFVDADVRLQPDCLARMSTFLIQGQARAPHPRQATVRSQTSPLALVSGFPRQFTGTPLEWLLLPLIHFVLLGFLPVGRMRRTTNPGFAAGCGQFFLCQREPYFACGGHSGIPLTMHDGLRLPRLFREHGYRTDLADLTPLAHVRMYTNARDTWLGLAKNATEGIAAPTRILPITVILLLGQVLPFLALAFASALLLWLLFAAGALGIGVKVNNWPELSTYLLCFLGALFCAWLPRFLAARRFKQDYRSALLHPVGIVLLLTVQWYSLTRKLLGKQVTWRNRAYTKPSA